jgi:acyl-CoA synthetase (AMP-forming)/AMP-acid ligase II
MSFFDDIGRHGGAPALVPEGGEPIPYASLAEQADTLGATLGQRGLAFLLARNCPESVIGYLAGLRSRTPTVLLAAGLHPDHLASLLRTYAPRYAWLPRERAAELPGARELFALGGYVLLATDAPPIELHPELAVLVTTSGTTGSRKLVRQSYGNLAANASAIAEYLQLDARERPITSLPMNYVYGLSVINSHLSRGASIVLADRGLMQKEFWELIRRHGVTSLAGVPYTYEMLRRLHFRNMALPGLRTLTQAGGKLAPALVEEFARIGRDQGIRFYVMYGAAEATARMSYLPPERCLEKPASIGIPIPGGELWIEDDAGRPVDGSRIPGELVFRGPNVALGYATRREDLALGDEWRGVLRTGDLAQRDADGFYQVVGRRSRFIKVFGNRVNLQDLEHLVETQGIECACTGEDDRLRIYVIGAADQQRVAAFVEERTGLHRSAYRVSVVEKLPRNEAGKIDYAALG